MGDFFHGWRRKIGVVTLLLACVFTGGWVRSLRTVDVSAFSIAKHSLVQLISREGSVAIRNVVSTLPVKHLFVDRVSLLGFQAPKGNSTGNLAINVDAKTRDGEGSPFSWIAKGYGVEIGSCSDRTFPLHVYIFTVPYWSIVIPLTLLSAYLLLVKPRAKKPSESN